MKQRSALYTLLAIVVVDLIGFGVVVPILPFYAESYGASATVLPGPDAPVAGRVLSRRPTARKDRKPSQARTGSSGA